MAESRLRALARRVGIGRALYMLYHRPVGLVRRSIQEGGPVEQRRTERGRLAMVEAARTLPELSVPDRDEGFEIHFLSGRRFWYQTLFCAYSLQVQSEIKVTPVIHDDGTLTDRDVERVRSAMPWAQVVRYPAIEALLDEHLPESKFPTLRARRLEYPHLRKLTDIHLGHDGWRLVLDSDMLFFSRPAFVLDWLSSPEAPCHMVDSVRSYGYSPALMESLAGAPVPDLVNVGLCGINGGRIDWPRLEHWCKALIEKEGTHYFQEQALTAMLLAGLQTKAAPPNEYVVLPSREEGARPSAVLHHYVAESKRSYFQDGWRQIQNSLTDAE